MKRSFILKILVFFLPVIGGYLIAEYLTRSLPSGFKKISQQIDTNGENFEVLILGSSQNRDGLNPALISRPTINMASGYQHHRIDRILYEDLNSKLTKINTVVLEVSYSHFELPHNTKEFWKNNVYLHFYGVNCFDRPTWFRDKLLYLSNPEYFSSQLVNKHITNERSYGFNPFGFDTLNYYGRFQNLDYDEADIAQTRFRINKQPNLDIFRNNSLFFLDFVGLLIDEGKRVIIVHPPMYKTFLSARNQKILERRDSVINFIQNKYPEIKVLDVEDDTTNYTVRDYCNQSHLNPDGARKFSAALNRLLSSN